MPPFNPFSGSESAQEKQSHIIKIDRTIPYVYEPHSGAPSTEKIYEDVVTHENEKSLKMTELDLSSVTFKIYNPTHVDGQNNADYKGEMYMLDSKGEEIHPDAKIYEILKNNTSLIPREWEALSKDNKAAIVFDGTDIKHDGVGGYNFVMYFSQTENGGKEYLESKRDQQLYLLQQELQKLESGDTGPTDHNENVRLIEETKKRIKDLSVSSFKEPEEWKWHFSLGFGDYGESY